MESGFLIENIYWLKTKLVLEVKEECLEEKKPLLVRGDSCYEFILSERDSEGVKRGAYYIDVCNINGEILPSGDWEIVGVKPEKSIYGKLDDLDKVLRYDKDYAYIVKLRLGEDNQIIISTDFMKKNPNPKKRDAIRNIIGLGVNSLYSLFRAISGGRKKNILFFSETRKDISANFKALYDRMLERGMDKNYRIKFLLDEDVRDGSSLLSKLLKIKEIAKSDYIFIDDYVPFFSVINLPKGVELIQLWHAGFGYKAVGYDRFGIEGSPHPYQSCHRKYTKAFVGNENLKDVYAGVFGIDRNRIIASGLPRMEDVASPTTVENIRKRLYNQYDGLKDKRIILFAPTYRGKSQKDAHYETDTLDQRRMAEMCRETNSIMIFKFHPFIRGGFGVEEENLDVLMDLSEENINDLMTISDVLITDYSSCFYDYLLFDRPIVFFLYDEEENAAKRGICMPVSETCPGTVVRSFDELMGSMAKDNLPRPKELAKDYMVDMVSTGGEKPATDQILDEIFG